MNELIQELNELANKNIFVTHDFESTGSDEWCFTFEIMYLPKEFEMAKRRVTHFERVHSFLCSGATYSGGWDTPEQALRNGVDYANRSILHKIGKVNN